MAASAPLPWWATFASAGVGASIAEVATLPIDTAKVRLQLLRRALPAEAQALAGASAAAAAPTRLGMLGMVRHIAATEGPLALYKGLWPALHRQLVFASLRVGLYGEPTDLVKVRFQSEGRLLPGHAPRYSGVLNAYATIVRHEGLLGLWTGLGPAIVRNSVINASELVTYDVAKQWLLSEARLHDNFGTHVLAASAAGLMATIVGNPVDVVKTRVMSGGSGGQRYSGAIDCFVKTLRHEGPAAFYQGVVPQFFRITGWNIVMFVSFEQLKRQFAARLN